jgi:hypothetical protein
MDKVWGRDKERKHFLFPMQEMGAKTPCLPVLIVNSNYLIINGVYNRWYFGTDFPIILCCDCYLKFFIFIRI